MNDRKTIVILTPAFPANESETNWVPSQQLLTKALKENFPHINLIVLALLYPYTRSEYSWNGIKVISFNGRRLGKLKSIFLFREVWRTLKRIQMNDNLVGIFSFWCRECALIGKWFGKWNSVKHFCWICGQDARKNNPFIKFIRPEANELIGISNFVANEFHKNYRVRPQHVIPNAIEPDLFPPHTEQRDIDILGVGSLTPLKQYDIFISVIKELTQYFPNLRAVHCGDGEEQEHIRDQVHNLGLANTVKLLFEQQHEKALRLMQRSKILLHPSAYEGFSTVCLEALYAGAHVVSFCDPMEGRIPHWHIVRSKNEMTEKILELLKESIEHSPVLLHTMDQSAKAVMNLFAP
jgi:glycosyltransferase involved in cell wall biosynthesis